MAGLPPLPKLPAPSMAGPTPWSNWVIPGRVIAGAYPASLDDVETERILSTMLELGMNTFVCLQAEVNINTPEHAWRSQHGLRPYIKDAQKILSKAHETGNPKITQQKIDFLHLPIIDGNVTTDSAMNRLSNLPRKQVRRLLAGQGATSAPPLHSNVRPAAGLPGRSASSVLTKPGGSILSSDMRPVVSPVSSMRSAQAPPSPLRSRIGGSGGVGGRYGLGRSESPMKAGYDRDYLRASAADRLANDFSKLSGPSVGRAGSNMPSYMLAQR
ncbi:hypothetical protein DUNSADRAFT_10344 [Dunaliella salina]|uniref:Uncharacterized protein n=1 Tax=Dunaliella salina TaxID=3046 RepID=A0ABQ7H4X0_DUNSA|nr:hypothetical protein DUNSADRAFT_10344 [Dunaliella salina]|eukprot:KAF5841907.1 hypothetical protein DUNSADRAFT_10344 [Dunaliella salina]